MKIRPTVAMGRWPAFARGTAPAARAALVGAAPQRAFSSRPDRLFTPGPLTTSASVKEAMQQDLGSRSPHMLSVVADVRNELLEMAHVSQDVGYECVIMQGSGTFAVESVVTSVVPRDGGRLLILSNGAYGKRLAAIAERYGIDHSVISCSEREAASPTGVEAELLRAADAAGETSYSHVVVVHHETTSGILNPMHEIGEAVRRAAPDASYIVDSMSAFGAYEVDMAASNVSYMVSSANKNIEGVPGFAFAICNRQKLQAEGGAARTLSLDLLAQWKGLEANGQFRFTPPTHALCAFHQALREHREEGGPPGRLARYQANSDRLHERLAKLGFAPYLERGVQGCIIATFVCPDDANFNFGEFYEDLAARGLVIYPGKLTEVECFRIGSIGQLFLADMDEIATAIEEVLAARGVTMPVKQLAS